MNSSGSSLGSFINYGPVAPTREPIIPANLKPFNLQAALAGDPVVTRGGQAVTQLVQFIAPLNGRQPLRAVIGGQIQAFAISGSFYAGNSPSSNDLFMAKKERTVYANVYPANLHQDWDRTGFLYETEELADKRATANRIGKAIPVTFFE